MGVGICSGGYRHWLGYKIGSGNSYCVGKRAVICDSVGFLIGIMFR